MDHIQTNGKRQKLTRNDWIMAGFNALLEAGADHIRIEALARKLTATKGSFYWHFKDLTELRSEILARWEELACTQLGPSLQSLSPDPKERLFKLVDHLDRAASPQDHDDQLEPAIREWARTDQCAQAALARVDQHRLQDLTMAFKEAGLTDEHASQGASMFYAALIGLDNLRISSGTRLHAPLQAILNAALSSSHKPEYAD